MNNMLVVARNESTEINSEKIEVIKIDNDFYLSVDDGLFWMEPIERVYIGNKCYTHSELIEEFYNGVVKEFKMTPIKYDI